MNNNNNNQYLISKLSEHTFKLKATLKKQIL